MQGKMGVWPAGLAYTQQQIVGTMLFFPVAARQTGMMMMMMMGLSVAVCCVFFVPLISSNNKNIFIKWQTALQENVEPMFLFSYIYIFQSNARAVIRKLCIIIVILHIKTGATFFFVTFLSLFSMLSLPRV
jgi:hypothetical protein